MPSITVNEKSMKVIERYQKSHAPGKVNKNIECKTNGDSADKLITIADNRLGALARNNAKNKGKPKKPRAAKPKAEKKAKAKAAPKTGLSKKLAKSKSKTQKAAPAPKLKGNRKRAPASAPAPEEADRQSKPVDSGDAEDDEPDPLAETRSGPDSGEDGEEAAS